MNIHTDSERLNAHSVPVPGPAELPIRSTFWHDSELERLGAELAEGQVQAVAGLGPYDVRAQVKQAGQEILTVVRRATSAQQAGEAITPAANWLLDNHYLVDDTILQIRRDLPRRYYNRLPTIEVQGGRIPRVLAIACLYVAHSDSLVSLSRFETLVEGFQSVEPLKIGELWALPSVLRFVLIENLRRLALRVDRAREMRRIANVVADKVILSPSDDRDIRILSDYAAHAGDTTFATQLLFRLRDGSQSAGRALAWLETELERAGTDAEEITLREHGTLSSGNVTTGNIIRGLRLINDIDWTTWFERVSRIDHMLRAETDFATLEFSSRDQYRLAIEEIAKRSARTEAEVARTALDLARNNATDIGFFLVGPRRLELEQAVDYSVPFGTSFYRFYRHLGWIGVAAPVAIFTAAFVLVVGSALTQFGLAGVGLALLLALFALPASEAAVAFFNTLVSLHVKPDQLIGYEYKEGVPADARTLVVVPTLIGSRDDIEDALRHVEIHFLSNIQGECHFALLSDWTDSKTEESKADLELLDFAKDRVAELNKIYPKEGAPRFYLLHRRRLFNESEGVWMGWERKRGKLSELNGLLRGEPDTTFFPTEAPLPDGIQFVMTLDADTRMTRGAVAKLVGKMRHPLNKPVAGKSGRIVSGYAIMQPRITGSLTTGDDASFFQRVFSANRGMDPYVFAASDAYQDLFGEGSFTGKGLYDIDAMDAALAGKIPENAVLSHDLLEGAYARSALVSDIELVEDYPTRYSVDASRQHRWVRGDWQLLPYIFKLRSGVPALSRWKMLDNLRRSLVPISWVLASVAGWIIMPVAEAAQWQALLVFTAFFGLSFDLLDGLMRKQPEVTATGHLASQIRDASFASAQVALRVIFFAHSAWSMGDAIVRTLYRVYVSRKHLLEWRTASQAARSAPDSLAGYFETMWPAPFVALAAISLTIASGSSGVIVALFFGLLWAISPAVAWFVSRSAETEDRLEVTPEDAATLRLVARRTWSYFETFVTAEHNMLPPDNFQETPAPVVAHRTSPTNVGVYLLSTVSARDFGWISLAQTVDRIDHTVTTLEKMERFRGHFYNWYETTSLRPLLPLYISSVDSGNLAGHLVAVAAACNLWSEAPAAHLQGDFEGIIDAARILERTLHDLPDDRRALRPLRQRLQERIGGMSRAVDTLRAEPEMSAIRTINLTVLAGDIVKLSTALHDEIGSTASDDLAGWAKKLAATCEAHFADSHIDAESVERLRRKLNQLRDRTRKLAFEMDFSFLLREDRKLLSIGYRVAEHQLDEACYDLLASEARLTSLFAIAKGDIQNEHWFRLGRPVTEIGFRGALVSWAGSMFEYLMPPLVMKEPQGGILNQSSKLIVKKQISYGRAKQIPWGISEAAYNARDRELTYQYTNFGVPGLGLKRGLGLNLVVAPYATILAAQFAPQEAVKNLHILKSIGAMGRYGFYDAVDFTPARLPSGDRRAVVYNYFAHHHGMSIVAIANVVFEGRMRDRFHSDPVIEAAELLLQEKAPRDIPATTMRAEAGERVQRSEPEPSPDSRLILNPQHALPAVNLMSNGRYSVMVTAKGAGYSRLGDVSVTRWAADPTEDRAGTFIFLTDTESGEWWSTTVEPKRVPGEISETFFRDDMVSFVKTVGTVRSQVECIVVSEGDGEARRVTIVNEGASERIFEVTSFAEIALAQEASDSAHPAFSKMFVKTEIGKDGRVVYATRQKRSSGDPSFWLAHLVTTARGGAREYGAETDRRAFIGRGRSILDPAAFERNAKLSGNDGFTLDPVMSVRCRVRVPAGKKIELTFWTLVAPTREELDAAVSRCDHAESFQRQAMLSWTRSQVQTRHVGLSLAEAAGVQRLARYLVYPDQGMRASSDAISNGLGRQSSLWPTSISGDLPMFVLRIGDVADLEIVATALRMQEYLRARGLTFDLVICNEQASSYVQDLQTATERLCENSRLRGRELGPRQHIFAVRRDLMDQETYRTLISAARVVVHTRNGTILDQVERAEAAAIAARAETKPAQPVASAGRSISTQTIEPFRVRPPKARAEGEGLHFWNGYGGFAENGRDYVVRLAGGDGTPQPWINVIANSSFGFHTSAEGASFTWSRNSRDFQITPWSNDPVANRPGEGVFIHDREANRAFSPLAALLSDPSVIYEARHAPGVSSFSATHGTLTTELTQLVDPKDPVKIARLKLRNEGAKTARLRVYAYAEWVLGNNRAKSAPYIVPGFHREIGVLTARNPYSLDFSDRTAFLSGGRPVASVTTDRREFIGADGAIERPQSVLDGKALSGTIEAGRDPCAAIAWDIDVEPGSEEELLILLGDASSQEQVNSLVGAHREKSFDERLAENERQWAEFNGTLQVKTPDRAFDAMVNTWLPYQSLACRIRARSAFYQASGAFGFRDQLQDTLALLLHDPSLAKEQILNAAGRQFPEGDVQHWWLPKTGAGVRTMISDDVVWLGYATNRYIEVTGDRTILDTELPFIDGPALKEGEHDSFFTPDKTRDTVNLYEHCARALDLAVARTGASGLPLILGGDWNDGMNRVGERGKGESVWLGWFLLKTLGDFSAIASGREDAARAKKWKSHATRLKKALESAGWDGAWYRRGSYDDGTPLGSASSDECRIDSIAQSWAVLSGGGDPLRAETAIGNVWSMLADSEHGLIKLFDPAFEKTEKEPGYIRSYPPGVRENGGQYTHAATWFVIALAEMGRPEEAYRAFSMINPVNHALDRDAADRYRVEPYVVAADVYAGGVKVGRGGWTWYTGSAGWLYRAAVEAILGIRKLGDRLTVAPCLPPDWPGFEVALRLGEASYRIKVIRSADDTVTVDGQSVSAGIPLFVEGEHDVEIGVSEASSRRRI
ncbi:MAG TPA: glucoamylase family protein [Rhizobiaceae bacterium]|nr:glucoamylase family protein [Rhizobiaceae bacterium]